MAFSINDALQLYNTLKGSNDYKADVRTLAPQNALVANALNIIQQCGGDESKAFYQLAKQACLDPQTILNMMK